MKTHVPSPIAYVLSFFLIPAAALAATVNHRGSLNVSSPIQIAGHQLAPGDYQVKWDGNGPHTQVAILQHGKTIVTAAASVKDLGQKSPYDANDVAASANGQKTLKEIRFGGQRYALQFSNATPESAKSRK